MTPIVADYTCARCGLPTNRDTTPSPCETHDICADCTPCDMECAYVLELDAADEHAAQQRRDAS